MNWIRNLVPPRIRSMLGVAKRDVPENMWIKDPDSGEMVFYKDLEANLFVFPGSKHHHRMPVQARLAHMFDGEFEKLSFPAVATDPLKFRDEKKYADRLRDAKAAADGYDSIRAGYGAVDGMNMVVAAQDMNFIGGSLGLAAGEAIIVAMRHALSKHCPFVFFVASGGARMQEGILSLMQLPRTTIAVQELRAAKLPYIVVLTNPTTGGVTASYAMLGDVHLAEPNALIGFAGQRVIEQTIREKLPEGFQRAEYLLEHGMVDKVVPRHEMKATVATIARILMKAPAQAPSTELIPA